MIKDIWEGPRYTSEELQARLKFFIGIVLGLTLFGIVFVVLYSLIFVTQPMNGMSPVDNKFFELIIPIATFLTGTLSGIMLAGDDKDLRMKAIEAANKPPPPSPSPSPVTAPRPFSPSPMPMAAMAGVAGVAAGAAMAAPVPAMPTMDKPMPSRPPLDEDFPPLD
jgi:Na+-transporting methylmalonyl-CoA/oxaloacetate decarboxylase gamma subunit